MQILPGISCCRLTNDANQFGCSRAFGEPPALFDAARRDDWREWIELAHTQDPGSFRPNGYTVTAFQAAIAAIVSTPVPPLDPAAGSYPCLHLQHALHAAVRIGDDTDTVAAIAGAFDCSLTPDVAAAQLDQVQRNRQSLLEQDPRARRTAPHRRRPGREHRQQGGGPT